MQRRDAARYRGFRALGATMHHLARLDPSIGGGLATEGDGYLGR